MCMGAVLCDFKAKRSNPTKRTKHIELGAVSRHGQERVNSKFRRTLIATPLCCKLSKEFNSLLNLLRKTFGPTPWTPPHHR